MTSASHWRARSRNDSTSSVPSEPAPSRATVFGVSFIVPPQARCVGNPLTVIAGGAELSPILQHPPEVQVEIVVPGHPDASVDLHAVLEDHRSVVTDVGLGHADQLGGVGRALVHRQGGRPGSGVGGLEPHLHVGEAVLEGLVRGQRSSEGVAVGGVLHGELEDPVDGTDHLGALQNHHVLKLAFDVSPDGTGLTEHGVAGHHHPVEPQTGEAPHQVDAADRDCRQPLGVRGHHQLHESLIRRSGDQNQVSLGSRPPPDGTCPRGRSRHLSPEPSPPHRSSRRGPPSREGGHRRAPGGHRLPADQVGQELLVSGPVFPIGTATPPPRWWGSAGPVKPGGPSPRPPGTGRQSPWPDT